MKLLWKLLSLVVSIAVILAITVSIMVAVGGVKLVDDVLKGMNMGWVDTSVLYKLPWAK